MGVEATAARSPSATAGRAAALKDALVAITGADGVRDDDATRALVSEDIWAPGSSIVDLVVSPRSIDELAAAIAVVTTAGYAVAPRGAGMSYTGGYVPSAGPTISVDLSRMDRIVAINTDDMTVTVEAGCTWARLYQALKESGVRTPFWGPMSGLTSTIGGGVSQLNAMLGAGQYGTSSESVVGLSVVLADGRILRTGARLDDSSMPFYRHYGPDLTGLFCGDSGALGIKAHVTLRLIRTPAHEGFASFSFQTGRALLNAMAELARAGIGSETCAFDPNITRSRMQRASLGEDLKTLGAVIGQQRSLVKGLLSAGRIALAGRDLVPDAAFPLHLIVDGRSGEAVDADLATARSIVGQCSGREIENSVAKVIRAVPFPPLNSVLGSNGERWNPIHGIAPLSKAADVFEAVEAVFEDFAAEFVAAGVTVGYLFTTLSTNGLIVEPVFYWPEARRAIHVHSIEPAHLAKLPIHAENPQATALVLRARQRVIAVFEKFGCAHFQIGRTYGYRASRDAASWDLLTAIKRTLDPTNGLNPGVLGFDESSPR